jgi:ubiquinone/menaquinone biosynthesis C-methylase UbiE
MASHVQDNISKEFDAFSSNYTEDMINVVPHYLKLMSCFGTDLPVGFRPLHVLDLGAGNGNSTAQVISLFPDAHYTMLDASPEMLSISESRFKNYNTTCVQSYFSEHDYGESIFDYIIAGFSLHHCDLSEKRTLYPKLYRSLKENGVMSFSDLCINKTDPEHPELLQEWEDFVRQNAGEDKWMWLMEHYEAFDRPSRFEDHKACFLEAGFSRVDIYWQKGFWMNVRAYK